MTQAAAGMGPGKIYFLTQAGASALRSAGAVLDKHHRRILQLIDGDTHADVIRGWLRHYSNQQLGQWIEQLEKMGLIGTKTADDTHDLDFTGEFPAIKPFETALTDTEVMRVDAATLEAGTTLKSRGAYLADARLKHRAPMKKLPGEITVLVVEDDPDQAALAERRLGLAGYKVRVAATHRAFIDDLRAHGVPDVVFLDVELPDGDGFDILVYMRTHQSLALLPVIMLTARTGPDDIRRGLMLGADGYIPKPYSKSLLSDTLRQVLMHH
jgi:CheY-like chemotaxis protein